MSMPTADRTYYEVQVGQDQNGFWYTVRITRAGSVHATTAISLPECETWESAEQEALERVRKLAEYTQNGRYSREAERVRDASSQA